MQTKLFMLVFATVSFSLSSPGHAQSLPDGSSSVAEQEDVASIEKTEQMLLSELQQNELAMYELFNGLNSSDEYDVNCRIELVEDLDRSIQFCEPVFLVKIRQQVDVELIQASSSRAGFFASIRNAVVSKDARREKLVTERAAASIALMRRELESLAHTNPELAAKLQAVSQSLLAYVEIVTSANSRSNYLMRQNDPTYGQAFSSGGRTAEPRPILGAPPPGHTQPTIRFPADISPRYRSRAC